MKLPTLDELIQGKHFARNSYVREKGFRSLYVRRSTRTLEGKRLEVLDLANMTASRPGKGAFTNLLERLQREHPALPLYVESVLNPRLAAALVSRFGFKPSPSDDFSFYRLPLYASGEAGGLSIR